MIRRGSVQFTETLTGPRVIIQGLCLDVECTASGHTDAMMGRVRAGTVQIEQQTYHVDPQGSWVAILGRDGTGSRDMQYRIALSGDRPLVLSGTKRLDRRAPGLLPGRIWRQTTTLHLRLDAAGETVDLGTATIAASALGRQVLSFRGHPADLLTFLARFTGRVAAGYLRKSPRRPGSAGVFATKGGRHAGLIRGASHPAPGRRTRAAPTRGRAGEAGPRHRRPGRRVPATPHGPAATCVDLAPQRNPGRCRPPPRATDRPADGPPPQRRRPLRGPSRATSARPGCRGADGSDSSPQPSSMPASRVPP